MPISSTSVRDTQKNGSNKEQAPHRFRWNGFLIGIPRPRACFTTVAGTQPKSAAIEVEASPAAYRLAISSCSASVYRFVLFLPTKQSRGVNPAALIALFQVPKRFCAWTTEGTDPGPKVFAFWKSEAEGTSL